MQRELYKLTKSQRQNAWGIKDFDKSMKLRQQEQENFEKLQLLNGLIKAKEKGRKNDKK